MTVDPATPYHVGLTPERVIDEALALTRETHLMSWSIRDLARRLGVAPSAIYHHVGGKGLLCRAVMDRVLVRIELPDSHLPWQDWFRTLLNTMGLIVAEYPGAAKWMVMHGPTMPGSLPILEVGMTMLRKAGFGERTTYAYALLVNNALLTIAEGDDRYQHEGDGPRDHATMMAEFNKVATVSEQAHILAQDLLDRFTQEGQAATQARWEYYHFMIETTLAGLRTLLDDVATDEAPTVQSPSGQ